MCQVRPVELRARSRGDGWARRTCERPTDDQRRGRLPDADGAVSSAIVRLVSDASDPVLAELLELIRRHGWAVRHVGAGSEPGQAAFSYTVGLTAMGHPEVVVTGLPFNHAQTFLNYIGADIRDGKQFLAGMLTEDLTEPGTPVAFLGVDDSSGLTAVEQVYGRVDAVQMVWPDSDGHLPWAAGYKNPPNAQPLLGPLPAP
jgi:hypothetical protein